MPIVLKRFSQDVDLENPEVSSNYLVLSADGREFRVPVPPETIRELTAQIYKSNASESNSVPDLSEDEGPSEKDTYQETSEDYEEEPEEEYVEDEEEVFEATPPRRVPPQRPRTPASEDEVPSL